MDMRPWDRNTVLAVATLALVGLVSPALAEDTSPLPPRDAESQTNQLKQGANSFAESQARDLLVQQGYSNVSPLVNDKNGIWHGKAIKDRKAVDVSVDYQGRVAAE